MDKTDKTAPHLNIKPKQNQSGRDTVLTDYIKYGSVPFRDSSESCHGVTVYTVQEALGKIKKCAATVNAILITLVLFSA